MSKEFATRNLVHNKIPEFPSGSGADRFLTKKEILDASPFARIEGSYSDVAIPIMDNVIYAEAAFSVSRTSFQLPQNTGSESFTVTSTIGGEALAWSVSEFNASWATYSVSGNSVSVHANADQTTESQKSGYIRVKQSVTNQEITVNFTQAAGVPTYTYTFSPSTKSLSFGATANNQSISVTSYRTKYINGHQVGTENLDYSSSSPGGGLTVSGTTFSVTENVVESSRSWSVVFTQSVSGNTFTISVTQAAASITWGHEFTSATTSLSFIATGETKRIAVNSIRRKYINGNPTTEVAAVPYTPSISGDSTFSVSSYDTSEIYIVAANNPAASQRTGTLTLSQQSSGKTLTISLSQKAGEGVKTYTYHIQPNEIVVSNTVYDAVTKTIVMYRTTYIDGVRDKVEQVDYSLLEQAGGHTPTVITTYTNSWGGTWTIEKTNNSLKVTTINKGSNNSGGISGVRLMPGTSYAGIVNTELNLRRP